MSLILVLVQIAVALAAVVALAWRWRHGGSGPGIDARSKEGGWPMALLGHRRAPARPEKQRVVLRRRGRRARVKAVTQSGLSVEVAEAPEVQELETFRDPFSGPGSYDGALPTKPAAPQRGRAAHDQAIYATETERPGTLRR